MSTLIDQISVSVKDRSILSEAEFITTDPSLNDTTLPIDPLNMNNKLDTDPSPNILLDVHDTQGLGTNGTPEPLDNRKSQNTGKLIHNWWVYYLKSLKKFLGDSFDDSINNFEFNYANKGVLLKKLYKQLNVNNPSCIINMSSFRTESNLDPKRRNSGFYNLDQTNLLAKNISKGLDVRVDFKFVNIQQEIIINFDDATDVLNYYDRFTTVYPLNKDFINYEYKTLINIHNETKGWDLTDKTDGLIYDAAVLGDDNHAGMNNWDEYKQPQRWAQYICCPQFNVSDITQMIDKQSQKYSLRIGLNTLLRVPQTIITRYVDEISIKAIQVVLDIGTERPKNYTGKRVNSDDAAGMGIESANLVETIKLEENGSPSFVSLEKPICIDIDRDIYNSYRMENVLYLSGKINFDRVNGKLILPTFVEPVLQNKAAALYIIQDSTVQDPELFWLELGYLHSENSEVPNLNLSDQNLINDFILEKRSDTYLKEVGIDLDFNWKPNQNDINGDPIPEPVVDTLEITLPNYDKIEKTLDNVGSWFDVRLFLFNMEDKGVIYG